MSSPKPALGYPSRTAAILAMREQGALTSAIATALGISNKAVNDLECSARLKRKQVEAVRIRRTDRLEDAIMDRWDSGMSAEAIAAELAGQGITGNSVRSVLAYMREGSGDHSFTAKTIRSQTEALIAAIRRHHPERCAL